MKGALLIFLLSSAVFAARPQERPDKFIVLTFDDGPRPEVIYGNGQAGAEGLADLLDRYGVKASFFMVGWKIGGGKGKEAGERIAAARDLKARGHAIENHTYGHGRFGEMRKKYGEEWILEDIERASDAIEKIAGSRPGYVRPPCWDIWREMRERIERHGYGVMTKSVRGIKEPLDREDVDTEDYAYYGKSSVQAGAQKLKSAVWRKIEMREKKGARGHILVFHELPLSVAALSSLIPELQRAGYRFLTLEQYLDKLEGEK